MHRTTAIFVFLTVFLARFPSTGGAQPLWVDLEGTGGRRAPGAGGRGSGPATLLSSEKELTLEVEIPGFYRGEKQLSDGKKYATVTAPGAGQGGIGMPDLPVFGSVILIPNGTVPVLTVEPGTARLFGTIEIAPVQPPPTDGEDGETPPFRKNTAVYAGGRDYPAEFASLEPIRRIRGQEFTVLHLHPFRYNPAYLGEYAVERIYYALSTVDPRYWSTVYFSGGPAGDAGDPVPDHLRKPAFSWDGNGFDITAAINAGRFLVTHRDHGSATSWSSPGYPASQVSALTNGSLLPVVWSVNCLTGFFDKETCENPSTTVSFSECWERNASGGAAGIIAASRVSYSGHNDRLFWGWTDAVWPQFLSGYAGSAPFADPAYRMGDVLNYGKLYYATTYPDYIIRKVEFEIFHWFGDPSMMIRTVLPADLAVEHPPAVRTGMASNFTARVESGGAPLSGATVTICRDDAPDDYRTAATDGNGTALFAGLILSRDGEYDLVVTAPNSVPYQGTVTAGPDPTPIPAPTGERTPTPVPPPPTAPPTPGPTASPSPPDDAVVVVCLGDSVTHGYPYADNGSPHLTYPAVLAGLLGDEYGPAAVYNRGENGYRAEDVIADLSSPDALGEDPDYVLLMIGGNDLTGATVLTILDIIEETTWEVQSCIDLANAHVNTDGSHPAVIVSAFIPNLLENGWGSLAVNYFNQSLEENISGHALWFTDNWDDLFDGESGEANPALMYDSVHPNGDGYAVLAANWLEALQTLMEPAATPTPSGSPTPVPPPVTPPILLTPTPAPATPTVTPIPAPTMAPTPTAWTPLAWPAGGGTEIGGLLPSGYEPSGAVWHERLGVLFLVSDDGWVSWMDQSGNAPVTWTPGGDLEGITVANGDSDYLYVGVEDPDSIKEFDITTGAYTGKSWDLTPWMTGAAGEGLEALTFVPDGDHPYAPSSSGGLFYAGLQADGRIYVFDADLAHSGTVSHIDTIEPYPGLTDLSGLHYHTETGVIYAVFDTWNLLLEMETDGTVIEAFLLPGDTQEGVTLMPSCPASATSIFIAEDAGEVWRYDGFPVVCLATPTPAPTATPPSPPFPTPSPLSPTPLPSSSPAATVTPTPPPIIATPTPAGSPTPVPPPPVTPAPRLTPSPTPAIPITSTPTPGPALPTVTPVHSATPNGAPTPLSTPIPMPSPIIATPTPRPVPSLPAPSPSPSLQAAFDYNGDGISDVAVFRARNGLWAIRSVTRVYFGGQEDLPVPGDYAGDGITAIAIFRPATGMWAIRGGERAYFGRDGDIPVTADYDGDGADEIALFREGSGLWAIRNGERVYFGAGGDQPVPADYDGDGADEIAVFREAAGLWAIRNGERVYFGADGDRPVPGDYDGDGACEIGIFRSGLWAIRGGNRIYFGAENDRPVPGQYDGTGRAVPAIFREKDGLWAARGVFRFYFGTAEDLPAIR